MLNDKFKKNVLVVGAGFLGRQVVNQLRPICPSVVYTHRQGCPDGSSGCEKFDFFKDYLGKIFHKYNIGTVILTAKVELQLDWSFLQECMECFTIVCKEKRLIYLSSDGIFDGRQGLYTETQKPFPVTNYGRNLEVCEKVVKRHLNHCIVRPSYIYGYSDGQLDSRLASAVREIKGRETVSRFVDMFKSPLHVNQVAEVIVKLALSDYIGTVHVAGPRMSVYDFTREGLESLGVSVENLVGVQMPKGQPEKYLPDTSLNSNLIQELTGIRLLGIKESFLAFG